MSASNNELESPLISPPAADTVPSIYVNAQLLNEGQQQQQEQQSNWFDHYRAREVTYYGSRRQPDRSDIAQFRDEQPVFGLWFAYYYYIVFLIILCVIIAIYYIIKYTT